MKIAWSGFWTDGSGYGEASRRLIAALQTRDDVEIASGLLLSDSGWRVAPSPLIQRIIDAELSGPADVHVIHCAAMDFDQVRPSFLTARRIGMTCWETDRLYPKTREGCKTVEKVIVPSSNNYNIFTEYGIPSAIVPYPIAMPAYVDELEMPNQQDVQINEDTFVFYSITSWQDRKNTVGLLMAFLHAFTREDNVALIMKISGPNPQQAMQRANTAINSLITMAQFDKEDLFPRPGQVCLLGGGWSENQIWGLHNRGDCYVSVARGEAFGLPMLDAACVGNRIITTGWGGQLDFLPPHLTTLLPYQMTPVLQAYTHFSGHQMWADPDLAACVAAMRTAFADGRRPKVRSDMSAFSPSNVAELLIRALDS